MSYKLISIATDPLDQQSQVTGIDGRLSVTVECEIDIDLDRDELEEMGVLDELEEDEDCTDDVVQNIRDNIDTYSEEIREAFDPTCAEVEDGGLTVRSGDETWPDLKLHQLYLVQFKGQEKGIYTLHTPVPGDGLDKDTIQMIWTVGDGGTVKLHSDFGQWEIIGKVGKEKSDGS